MTWPVTHWWSVVLTLLMSSIDIDQSSIQMPVNIWAIPSLLTDPICLLTLTLLTVDGIVVVTEADPRVGEA